LLYCFVEISTSAGMQVILSRVSVPFQSTTPVRG